MSIKNKLITIFVSSIIVFLMAMVIVVRHYEVAFAEADEVNNSSARVMSLALRAQVEFKTQVQEWKNILLRGYDDALYEKHLASFNKQEQRTRELIDELLLELMGDNELHEKILAFSAAHEEMGQRYRTALPVYKLAEHKPHITTDKYVRGMDREPVRILGEIVATVWAERDAALAQIHSDMAAKRLDMMVLLGVVILVLAVIFLWLIGRVVFNPLNRVVTRIAAVTEDVRNHQGDLAYRLPIKSKDELAALSNSFNVFMSALQVLVDRIKSSTTELNTSSSGLMRAAEETHKDMQEQQQGIENVSLSLSQMSEAVREVAGNAQQASDATGDAAAQASAGRIVVQQVVDTMEHLSKEVEQAGEVIRLVNGQAQGVNKILETINGIAEQTNLLALNAAIEAARAGEQGRGFAVVADEVRVLAGHTETSTREIQDIIQTLQRGASKAVEVMVNGREASVACMTHAHEANRVLNGIDEALTMINQTNQCIASAVEQQTAVSEEIVGSIENISDLSVQTASDSRQVMFLSQQAAVQSDALQRVVNAFK
ncbi:methyl-accepting chemotaxis protein [Sulfuriflexus sp.]|uniref:methyl-accepting chemotaxis protein n=1 Tax=Sulfuriflexus sp. TaxID=2015443 RepID=UPI0028CD5BE6|nr:methyl-accepting chemotaxis protein [Sulfuriflexus sp.]MDT8403868.1 methyl-accepting chemotaxis protein [Sulfuriflexus sp.]